MMLQDRAAKGRARATSQKRSLLCGKIFDETGDRLTPSHTKTKAGVRLRYYVSHRLIKNSGEANKNGWRLPAEELEQKVAYVVRRHISKPSFIGSIAPNATVETVHAATAKLQPITTSKDIKPLLELAEHVELQQGELRVVLAQKKGAAAQLPKKRSFTMG